MNKIVALVIGGVVVVGGATALIINGGSEDDTNTGSSNSTSQTAAQFSPAKTTNLSFVATTTSTVDGKTTNSVMESDAKTGAIRYKAGAADSGFTFIYTKDAYYMCPESGACFKYALGQGQGAAFDPKTYQYDDAKIADYKTNTKSLGRESCPAGTCEVWQVSGSGYGAKIYIDNDTKRVSQVISDASGVSSKIVYEYRDVSVEIPTNIQELPTAPTM